MVELQERLQVTEEELREDIGVLNIVNFGAGSYVLYAEIDEGEVSVDPEPYSDTFARPARLLPVEAKALVAAIDLIGEHIPEGSLASARKKVVEALGGRPGRGGLAIASVGPPGDDGGIARTISKSVADRRILEFEYYKANEDEFSSRTVEPYALINGLEGWYVAAWDLNREALGTSASTGSSPRQRPKRPLNRAPKSTRLRESKAGLGPERCPSRTQRRSGCHRNAPAGRARSERSRPS